MPGYQFFRHPQQAKLTYLATNEAVYLSQKQQLLSQGFSIEPKNSYVQADNTDAAIALYHELNAAELALVPLTLTNSTELAG